MIRKSPLLFFVLFSSSIFFSGEENCFAIDLKNRAESGINKVSYSSTAISSALSYIAKVNFFMPLRPDLSGFSAFNHKPVPILSLVDLAGEIIGKSDSTIFKPKSFIKNFEAKDNGRCVLLKWSTEAQHKELDFCIFRRDGFDNIFKPLNSNTIICTQGDETGYHYLYEDFGVEKGQNYYYKIVCTDLQGLLASQGPIAVTVPPPHAFELEQNYPNPFNPNTTIAFSLPRSAPTSLVIYNMNGQLVRTLINQFMSAGRHIAIWDGRDDKGQQVASGIYFYTLMNEELHKTRRMQLVR